MVGDGQQSISIRRQIDAHNFGFFVDNVVNKSRVLMRKTVVILSPNVRCEQIIQRRNRSPPRNLPGYFQPFGVLVEHRINDVDKGFVARKKPVPSGQKIAFEPTLTKMFAQNFHHATVVGKMIVGRQNAFRPRSIRRFKNRAQTVRRSFVGTEQAKVFGAVVQTESRRAEIRLKLWSVRRKLPQVLQLRRRNAFRPRSIRRFKNRAQTVRRGFVGTEQAKVFGSVIEPHHVAQESA